MRVVLFSRVPRWYSFRGDRLVARLAREGHEVVGIVAERRPTLLAAREWVTKLGPGVVAQKVRDRGLRRLGIARGGQASPAHTGVVAAGESVPAPPAFFVDSHNSEACVALLRSLAPDVLVLRGCGIVKKHVLDVPAIGTINPHYATLPDYRGMDVTEWAALHGDPVAVSVHWVGVGVDTGGVIASAPVPVEPGDTVGLLREKSAAIVVDLIAGALARIEAGLRPASESGQGRQYFQMHPRLRRLANRRLESVA